jgi:hypothetical protein
MGKRERAKGYFQDRDIASHLSLLQKRLSFGHGRVTPRQFTYRPLGHSLRLACCSSDSQLLLELIRKRLIIALK